MAHLWVESVGALRFSGIRSRGLQHYLAYLNRSFSFSLHGGHDVPLMLGWARSVVLGQRASGAWLVAPLNLLVLAERAVSARMAHFGLRKLGKIRRHRLVLLTVVVDKGKINWFGGELISACSTEGLLFEYRHLSDRILKFVFKHVYAGTGVIVDGAHLEVFPRAELTR